VLGAAAGVGFAPAVGVWDGCAQAAAASTGTR
jgi:hypothetical protein